MRLRHPRRLWRTGRARAAPSMVPAPRNWQASMAFFLLLLWTCGDPSGPENGPNGGGTVSFSHEAGFHQQPFDLALTSPTEDATIYYTVDGSTPDPERVMDDEAWAALSAESRERTFVYDGPLDLAELAARDDDLARIPTNDGTPGEEPWSEPEEEVQKAVVVRAVAHAGEGSSATADTRTYFIAPEGRARYSLPVISLTTGRRNFFAADSGIYVPGASGANFDERGREWERLAHVELFDLAGARPVAQDIGVRIHGGWTRRLPQKSLRLYSRSDYGTSRFSYAFFDSKSLDDYNRILLRNAGNDWGRTLFRDAAIQTLVQHLSFDTQHHQPAIVFLNGVYWGIHNIRDRLDQHYVETHYDVPRDEVTILEGRGEVSDGEPGDGERYHDFIARVNAEELDSWADFDEYMEVSGFLDYMIAQWFAANTDWPENNIDWWRYKGPDPTSERGPRDGRWRWMMYDMDHGFGLFGTENTNMPDHVLVNDVVPGFRDLFRGLLRVPEIRHEFLQRSAVHVATTFRSERVRSHIDSLAAIIEPEIAEHVARWNRPGSVEDWNQQVQRMIDFANARPEIFRSHMVGHFGEVQGTAELGIANLPGGGGVTLHGVELSAETPGVVLSGGAWSGELFTGIPVELRSSSVNLSGATVSGGAGDVEQSADELRFTLTGSAQITLP